MFCVDKRPKVKAGNPELNFGEISEELSARWKSASAQVRARYEELTKGDSRRYRKEMVLYKQNVRKQQPIDEE